MDSPVRLWVRRCAKFTVVIAFCLGCSTPERSVILQHGRQISLDRDADDLATRFRAHIAMLAHDELEGRATGSNGIDLAAGYIAGQFAAAGLSPGGPHGTYLQNFDLSTGVELLEESSLTPGDGGTPPELRVDFLPFGFSTTGSFESDVIFVGYGINNPDRNHNDYANVDVKGKTVLMIRREPTAWSEEGEFSDHARFDHKIELARDEGAVAVLIVNQDPGEDDTDRFMRFRSRGETYGLPAIHIKRTLADRLLASGGLPTIRKLQSKLDANGEQVSAPLHDVHLRGTVSYKEKKLLARNVIGLLPGTGGRADEYIVIGGHYDHLGIRRGEIHNGADDNASGTSGVIELAWSLASLGRRERSVLFVAFSGEEIGLRGSKHFVAEPTVGIESIKAMINLDMIGRLTPNQRANMLSIQGLGTGDVFAAIVEQRAQEANLEYIPDRSALGPSDHAPFYRAGIPSLFFFTGVHEDYHAPGDDVEKVNSYGAARIIRLVHNIAADLINADDSPKYAEVTERANIFRGAGPTRAGGVIMGIMPDMDDQTDAAGWRIARVFPGGGAETAGMKPGDRLLKLDGQSILSLRDYRKATADKKPGDTVEVLLRRGSNELTLTVELAARGG